MLKQFAGNVIPPIDMMEAARKSLSEQAFRDLMEQTGGTAPTPDQLCKMADSCRQAASAGLICGRTEDMRMAD